MAKRNKRIGVMVSTRDLRAHDHNVYRGILKYSREHDDFDCVLAPFAAEDLKSAPRKNPPYDGILAMATPELVDEAMLSRVPIVDVWRDSIVQVPVPCVFPDFMKAGRMAAEHLMSRGFEHFGFVVSARHSGHMTMCDAAMVGRDQKRAGVDFVGYLKAQGMPCSHFVGPQFADENVRTWRKWTRDIRKWIESQSFPLALFVPQDFLCRYIADLALQMGLKIPHDLGLICADNEPNMCVREDPSLTAIDLDYRRVGYEAASLLDGLLSARRRSTRIETRLVEPKALLARRSTDAVVLDDPLVGSAMRYILEHSHEPIKVTDVVRAVSTTRRTLERRFREVLDRTAMQEITRARLAHLKRRLAESNEPIKILALNSGFNSVRILYETFVREEGISPSAYRAKRRKN